jgi:uncharacterized protein
MKKKINFSYCLLLFVFTFTSSQTFALDDEKSLLWKISGKNLREVSYLFGTIHIICEDQFMMDTRIEQAFAQSKNLVLEINMADPNLVAQMQQLSVNPGFKNLKVDLDENQSAVLNKFLQKHYGAGLDQLGILKPFVLSSMLMVKMLPCERQSSYEVHYMEKAQARGISVLGLETVSDQIAIFDRIPQDIQVKDLIEMLQDPKGFADFDRMVAKYLDEDIAGLFDLITENKLFQEYGDLLLTNRNQKWIQEIEAIIEKESAFIAVGAGHLSGKTGVISLLRNAGYTVEAVK